MCRDRTPRISPSFFLSPLRPRAPPPAAARPAWPTAVAVAAGAHRPPFFSFPSLPFSFPLFLFLLPFLFPSFLFSFSFFSSLPSLLPLFLPRRATPRSRSPRARQASSIPRSRAWAASRPTAPPFPFHATCPSSLTARPARTPRSRTRTAPGASSRDARTRTACTAPRVEPYPRRSLSPRACPTTTRAARRCASPLQCQHTRSPRPRRPRRPRRPARRRDTRRWRPARPARAHVRPQRRSPCPTSPLAPSLCRTAPPPRARRRPRRPRPRRTPRRDTSTPLMALRAARRPPPTPGLATASPRL